jgi:hypothetical protein
MMTIRSSLIAAFALAASSIGSPAIAQPPLTPAEMTNLANGLPAPRCSRPFEQEATRAAQLAGLMEQARAAMDKNPLLWATFKYYEAELAATRRCLQSASAGNPAVR